MKVVDSKQPMTVTLHMTLRPVVSNEDAAARIEALVKIVDAMDASWLRLRAEGLPEQYAEIFMECVAKAKASRQAPRLKVIK